MQFIVAIHCPRCGGRSGRLLDDRTRNRPGARTLPSFCAHCGHPAEVEEFFDRYRLHEVHAALDPVTELQSLVVPEGADYELIAHLSVSLNAENPEAPGTDHGVYESAELHAVREGGVWWLTVRPGPAYPFVVNRRNQREGPDPLSLIRQLVGQAP
ncbi:MAG: hypothetical protein IT429_26090 [Gemmataceae bacterium]|nr:hypothetical protein [Gemmataceae bacterium]